MKQSSKILFLTARSQKILVKNKDIRKDIGIKMILIVERQSSIFFGTMLLAPVKHSFSSICFINYI